MPNSWTSKRPRTSTIEPPPLRVALADSFRVPAPQPAVDWIPSEIIIPEETETPGRFDLSLVPHVAEVLEEFDNPDTRIIVLCWAARLAKTTTALSLLTHGCVTQPRPGLFCSSDQDRCDDTIDSQLYPILEACRPAADLLPPKQWRNKRYINLRNCRIRKATSGSPSSLAGFPACYIVANELAKWSKRKSSEADPLYLIQQRAKNYPHDSKIIFESTPGLLENCNITRLLTREGTDQRMRWVPCPHCGEYQLLTFGSRDADAPGLHWHKNDRGHSDVNLAEESAYYRCVSGCKIENHDRPEMMRRGVWLSKGQSIDKRGKISGQRERSPDVGFGPLSSLYSLLIGGWGQIARDFLNSRIDTEGRRDFQNSTLCLPWDPQPVSAKPSEIVDRMGCDPPLRNVPDWAKFLTASADVGQVGEDLVFYWAVCAWGRGQRGQLIDLGITLGEREFAPLLVPGSWVYGDLPVAMIGVDSGKFTRSIYDLVRPFGHVWPIKGSSHNVDNPYYRAEFPDMYRPGMQTAGRPAKLVEALRKQQLWDLILPNTNQSQQWLEDRLAGIVKPDDPRWFSIPKQALIGEVLPGVDLTHHLLGDRNENGIWRKRYEDQDMRDAIRYARIMAELYTNGGELWDVIERQNYRAQPAARSVSHTPDDSFSIGGGSFLASDR